MADVGTVLGFVIDTALGPSELFRRMGKQPRPGVGLEATVLASGLLAAFSFLLYANDYMPSFTGNGLNRREYYLYQAGFVVPLMVGCWLLYVAISHFVARLFGGKGSARALMGALGLSWSVPVLLAYVVPELVVYFSRGFDHLSTGLKYYGPLCVLWGLILGVLAVKEVERIGTAGAVIAAVLGFGVQGALAAWWIR